MTLHARLQLSLAIFSYVSTPHIPCRLQRRGKRPRCQWLGYLTRPARSRYRNSVSVNPSFNEKTYRIELIMPP